MSVRLSCLLLLTIIAGCNLNDNKQSASIKGKGKLKFVELSHSFGELNHGDVVGHRFKVINEGKYPVVIQKVEKGCGCTDVIYKQQPIKPNDTTFIEVVFDTNGWHGRQVKQVVIHANDSIKKHELLVWTNIKSKK
ncbi:DUF1573 domain-containing protein [Carboxylicivirga marina]|uniref:DUF1573 domain-containing protein n=1 Tax=Carboxylicivirga marina TaxID=2800988 RepID=A0ABS1HP91_9BACT|nr:DUF1573 domain-containing protein [Carboxylicivirga marina]MBK3519352.1 DUF1573 domain-containing protein [Carboxylicivirga marina]